MANGTVAIHELTEDNTKTAKSEPFAHKMMNYGKDEKYLNHR